MLTSAFVTAILGKVHQITETKMLQVGEDR